MIDSYTLLIISVVAVVTIILRFLPFIIFNEDRKTPKIISKLSNILPYAIMGMLVIYCFKDISFNAVSGFLPMIISGFVVVISYVWKRNTLISIVIGTVCYMLLVQLVF